MPPADAARRSALHRAVGLSDADRELITLLQADGRAPVAQLARVMGAPEHLVRRRLAELLDAGVMRIRPVTAYAALGLKAVATLGVTVTGRSASDVARDMMQIDAVNYLNVSAGRYDVFVGLGCTDLTELQLTVDRQVRGIPGVQHVEVFPYIRRHYQEALFRGPRVHDAPIKDGVTVDDTDRALITELGTDGRMSLQRVADRLGTSERRLRPRLTRLRADGVIRLTAIVNPLSLGFDAVARFGVKVRPGWRLRPVADAIKSVEAISYIAICAGRFDLFCLATCVDAAELAYVIEEVRMLDGIAECEAFMHLEFFFFDTPRTPPPSATP